MNVDNTLNGRVINGGFVERRSGNRRSFLQSMSRLLFSCQAGLLLRFTAEAHCSVERAVVAKIRVAGDALADLCAFVVESGVFVVAHIAFHLELCFEISDRRVISRGPFLDARSAYWPRMTR